jgi:hypothetical protein
MQDSETPTTRRIIFLITMRKPLLEYDKPPAAEAKLIQDINAELNELRQASPKDWERAQHLLLTN